MHLQLCYPPAYAAPDAVAKWNGAKVVKTFRGMFTHPAVRPEVQRTGEILVIQRRGVVTQGQLSLTKMYNENSWAIQCLYERYSEKYRIMYHSINAKHNHLFFNLLQNMNAVHSNLLCLYQSYPFGDEIFAQHQVILRNSTVAWENWEKPAPRKEQTKSVIHQHCTLISATMLNYKINRW